MAEFKRDYNRYAPKKSFGGPARGGRDFGAAKEMHDAECSRCHKVCQVPFRPNGKKPVFCRDCFEPTTERNDRFDRAPRPEFKSREYAAPAARPDTRAMDEIFRQLKGINETLINLSAMIEEKNRVADLGSEVRKHVAAEEKPAKKVVKKVQKKVSKR